MLRQGPISLTLHSLLEPFVAALLIAAPFLFGFHDESAATAVSIVLGFAVLVVAMSTDWKLSLIKAIPIPAHLMIDFGAAALLVASPFLFGFSDHTGATTFFIVMAVGELLAALGTRWYPAKGDAAEHGGDAGRRRWRRGRGAQPTV